MKYKIISGKDLIINQTKNKTGGSDFVLKKHAKLGEIFSFLPTGIINKTETGIGATTLELISKRNSLIIEPLIVTVEQKKAKYKGDVFAFLTEDADVVHNLQVYLNNPQIKHKKILLVIDNLEKVISILGDDVKKYFILFDEIDFMQSSSNYRSKIESAVDLALLVTKKIALISATLISFSHPKIKKLPVTSYSYLNTDYPIIYVHKSLRFDNCNAIKLKDYMLNQCMAYLIEKLNNSEDKLLIVINSVKKIDEIATMLVNMGIVALEDITLLISNKSDNYKFKSKYSNKEIHNFKLPTRVNFITSAYYNGYDLEDEYELVIASSPSNKAMMVSANEIKQIYGRCRNKNGVKKCSLFYHDLLMEDLNENQQLELQQNETSLLELANELVNMQNCMDKYFNKSSFRSGTSLIKQVQEHFSTKVLDYEYYLARKKIIFSGKSFKDIGNPKYLKKVNEIAFFKVDALVYQIEVKKEMYITMHRDDFFSEENEFSRYNHMSNILAEKGFYPISVNTMKYAKIESKKITQDAEIQSAVAYIKQHMDTLHDIDIKKLTKTELTVYKLYTKAKDYFTTKSIFKELEKIKSKRQLSILEIYITHSLDKIENVLLRCIKTYFKNGECISSEELILRVGKIYEELNSPSKNKNILLKEAIGLISLCYTPNSKNIRNGNQTNKVYELKKPAMFNLKKLKK